MCVNFVEIKYPTLDACGKLIFLKCKCATKYLVLPFLYPMQTKSLNKTEYEYRIKPLVLGTNETDFMGCATMSLTSSRQLTHPDINSACPDFMHIWIF